MPDESAGDQGRGDEPREILVVAENAVIAALMGTLVELAGHTPHFPRIDERPLDAITRVRPALLLLDCDHDLACEDEAYARAEAVGAEILLFTPSRTPDEIREFAEKRDVEWMTLPISFTEFRTTVTHAMAS